MPRIQPVKSFAQIVLLGNCMPRKPNWKIVFQKKPDPLYLYQFKNMTGCLTHRVRETFDVYALIDGEEVFAYHNEYQLFCGCGREYNRFRFRATFMDYPQTKQEQLAWFKLPVLCMICYYKTEINKGNWAPKQVYKEIEKELGLEK